jgi:hypothetical protein
MDENPNDSSEYLVNEHLKEEFCKDLVESSCGTALVEISLTRWKIDHHGKLSKK